MERYSDASVRRGNRSVVLSDMKQKFQLRKQKFQLKIEFYVTANEFQDGTV